MNLSIITICEYKHIFFSMTTHVQPIKQTSCIMQLQCQSTINLLVWSGGTGSIVAVFITVIVIVVIIVVFVVTAIVVIAIAVRTSRLLTTISVANAVVVAVTAAVRMIQLPVYFT